MRITSVDNLIEWIDTNRDKYRFRCYTAERELISSLGRLHHGCRGCSLSNHEFHMLKDFALGLIDSLNKMTFTKVVEIGQHFGLPTRYIDFTIDPFIALFFGLGRHGDNGKFKLCFLSESNPNIEPKLNQVYTLLSELDDMTISDIENLTIGQLDGLSPNTVLNKDYLMSKKFENDFLNYFAQQEDFSLIPYDVYEETNPRIMAQKGLFIAMKDPEIPIPKSIFSEIEIDLNHNNVQELRKTLFTRFNATSLFPDHIGGLNVTELAESIVERHSV